jgi:hypothetical protein
MLNRRGFLQLGGAAAAGVVALPERLQAAESVLQTVFAWHNGNPLPPSTGQIVDQTVADQVIATNLSLCPRFGYTVDGDGSFTDPVSGITILQGYVEAAPFYDVPAHPFSGAPAGLPPTKAPPTIDVGTALIFAWGQSQCACFGRGRYAATNPNTWAYGGSNTWYPCSDPIADCSGTDGSVWSRCADASVGRSFNGGSVTKFVIRNVAVGGTSINAWAPGGSQHSRLISACSDFMAHVGMPTHLVYSQGENDALTQGQWVSQWYAMLNSLRGLGCTSKIWTSIETICDIRIATDPNNPTVINHAPDWYVAKEAERLAIRSAQIQVGNVNQNTRQGPNLDLIDWRLRAAGDGCHFSELGMAAAGRLWAAALFP